MTVTLTISSDYLLAFTIPCAIQYTTVELLRYPSGYFYIQLLNA